MILIQTDDKGIFFRSTAATLDQALEALAAHYEYSSYATFCADLGFNGSDFNVSFFADERAGSYDPESDRKNIFEQQARTERNAFKFLRRLTG